MPGGEVVDRSFLGEERNMGEKKMKCEQKLSEEAEKGGERNG